MQIGSAKISGINYLQSVDPARSGYNIDSMELVRKILRTRELGVLASWKFFRISDGISVWTEIRPVRRQNLGLEGLSHTIFNFQ